MWRPIVLFLSLLLIGTIGFHLIETISFLDSLYMTIITVFTVGFREIKEPLSPAGQVFTIFIILGGVGSVMYAFTKLAEIVYEGTINKFWRRRRMEKKIQKLKDHYIICGHGRMGNTVRERLEGENLPYVVIDNSEEGLVELRGKQDCLHMEGDATNEDVLIKAGIKRAKALAALLATDADNLYLVMTVKLINPSLFVLSKVMEEEAERKILQIGANKVVSPYKLSGLKMAQALIRPTLVDFLDLIIRRSELSLSMEELLVKKNSKIVERTLAECDIRRKANIIVVAIKKPGEDIVFNPSPGVDIESGDTLLVLGENADIDLFEKTYIEEGN
ncbi:MAG: potassium channel protein [Candidatus Aminicenantes bacterium]|nr:MAG: potassium channel protein [Candidatus Aminicenantes bacterium]